MHRKQLFAVVVAATAVSWHNLQTVGPGSAGINIIVLGCVACAAYFVCTRIISAVMLFIFAVSLCRPSPVLIVFPSHKHIAYRNLRGEKKITWPHIFGCAEFSNNGQWLCIQHADAHVCRFNPELYTAYLMRVRCTRAKGVRERERTITNSRRIEQIHNLEFRRGYRHVLCIAVITEQTIKTH